MNDITDINIEKPFWTIVKHGDVDGYHTGTKSMNISLFEFDNAKKLKEFLSDGIVESGESMGVYCFKILTVSHNHNTLNEIIEHE